MQNSTLKNISSNLENVVLCNNIYALTLTRIAYNRLLKLTTTSKLRLLPLTLDLEKLKTKPSRLLKKFLLSTNWTNLKKQ